jgi:hypothetical protein
LRRENEQLKRELEQSGGGGGGSDEYLDDGRIKRDSMQKEIKLLKQMIRTIEEANLKEKNLLTKKLQQKAKEMEHLRVQCEKLRINERHMQSEMRSLHSQLRIQRSSSSRSSLAGHHRSSSLESFRGRVSTNNGRQHQQQQPPKPKFTNFLEQNRLNLRHRSTSPAFSRKSNLSPSTSIDSLHSYGSVRSKTGSIRSNSSMTMNSRRDTKKANDPTASNQRKPTTRKK